MLYGDLTDVIWGNSLPEESWKRKRHATNKMVLKLPKWAQMYERSDWAGAISYYWITMKCLGRPGFFVLLEQHREWHVETVERSLGALAMELLIALQIWTV